MSTTPTLRYRGASPSSCEKLADGSREAEELVTIPKLRAYLKSVAPDGTAVMDIITGKGLDIVRIGLKPESKPVPVGGYRILRIRVKCIAKRPLPRLPGGRQVLECWPVVSLGRVASGLTYAVDPRGNRFLMIRPAGREAVSLPIRIVLNWFSELRPALENH
jgi:hypothetical protein